MSDIRLHYPLEWPSGWKRQPWPSPSPFSKVAASRRLAISQGGRLLKCSSIEVSSNIALNIHGSARLGQAQPKDRGVAVYFQLALGLRPSLRRMGSRGVQPVRHWQHVEAMRAQHRYRVGSVEQSFSGYLRLPAPLPSLPWWQRPWVSARRRREEVDAAFQRRCSTNLQTREAATRQWLQINGATPRKVARRALMTSSPHSSTVPRQAGF